SNFDFRLLRFRALERQLRGERVEVIDLDVAEILVVMFLACRELRRSERRALGLDELERHALPIEVVAARDAPRDDELAVARFERLEVEGEIDRQELAVGFRLVENAGARSGARGKRADEDDRSSRKHCS